MDIRFKLKILFWLLVISLWGTILFQFMWEDISHGIPKMTWVKNPFPEKISSIVPQRSENRPASNPFPNSSVPPKTSPPGSHLTQIIVPEAFKTKRLTTHLKQPKKEKHVEGVVPTEAPQGFYESKSSHFLVYHEGKPATEELLATLEDLHGNIMLDLAAFSPWAREQKITIYLFNTQSSYQHVTGRPRWSAGASSLEKRTIYIYLTEESFGILAHELCHIYFDSFFERGKPNPLWLSEGMATLIQVERGLSAPDWLKQNLNFLVEGGGFQFKEFLRLEETNAVNDKTIRLWYAQAYSLVRFLKKLQHPNSFYNFCNYLKRGRSLAQSLYLAYGMPFNRVSSLEYAWRGDLKFRSITRLNTQAASEN